MSVAEAVRALRALFGETQQDFAYRCQLAIRTVARFENGRIPEIDLLASFMVEADAINRPDLAEIFRAAVARKINHQIPRFAVSADEHPILEAVLVILRDADQASQQIVKVKELTGPIIKQRKLSTGVRP